MPLRKILLSLAVSALAVAAFAPGMVGAQDRRTLQPPSTFDSIADRRNRSVAIFAEAGKVITHPRCVNCHPATDRPLQGDSQRLHIPRIVRGEAGMGVPGLACTACHGRENVRLVGTSLASVPGNPQWHLAPAEMAWQGRSLAEICTQIKDQSRNGGRSLADLQEHMAKDELVGWGWDPGPGREPAPGTQAQLGALIQAWIDTGAECP